MGLNFGDSVAPQLGCVKWGWYGSVEVNIEFYFSTQKSAGSRVGEF